MVTNCKHICSRFAGVRCDGSHDHIMCCDSEGGEKRSKYAQYYPRPFLRLRCRVLRGLLQEHPQLNWGKDACRVI